MDDAEGSGSYPHGEPVRVLKEKLEFIKGCIDVRSSEIAKLNAEIDKHNHAIRGHADVLRECEVMQRDITRAIALLEGAPVVAPQKPKAKKAKKARKARAKL